METQHQRAYWPTTDWKEANLRDHGMNPTVLTQLDAYARESTPEIHSLLIVRDGYIVFEKYYHGFGKGSYHSVSSVTKSIVSALVGVALGKGLIQSLDQRVFDFFPEYAFSETDPRKQALTLRHLLSMTAGFSREFPQEYGQNPVRRALERPMEHGPGEQFYYDSQGVDIVSGILTRATGMSAAGFAHTTLFKSLGIWQKETARFVWRTDPNGAHTWHRDALFDETSGFLWKVDPQGYSTGSFGAHLTAREMAKLGYLYLNGGFWDGEQVVPADYIANSTRKQSEGGPPVNVSYAYLWWVTQHEKHAAFFASGYGGKFIYVIPDLDLIFIMTSTSESGPGSHHREAVSRFVIPAVM